MNLAIGISLVLALGALAAPPAKNVPSNPSQWDKDFLSMARPTPACPGGSVDALRKRMAITGPYMSADAFHTATLRELPPLRGVAAGDRYYSFQYTSEPVGGGFWGFAGYLVTRGACIVHAQVTSRDN
jgi:hypothetical protein